MKSIAILTNCVPTLPLDLAAANDDMRPAAWMKAYGHLVEQERHVIQLVTLPERPALDFHPGDAEPDFDALAYHLAVRFQDAPHAQVTFISALSATRKLYGGRCHGLPKKTAASHDALLAAFFLSLDERTQRHLWVPEAKLRWRHRPDGLILVPKGRGKGTIIEIGGIYPAAKLKKRHAA